MWRGSLPSGNIQKAVQQIWKIPQNNHHHLAFYVFSSCWVCSMETSNPKKRRPHKSQLIARLFSHVVIHDKKWFDSSFEGYIHISTKGSATEGDLRAWCCSAFELKHISSLSHWRHTGTQTPGNYSALWFPCREILLSTPKDRERNPELVQDKAGARSQQPLRSELVNSSGGGVKWSTLHWINSQQKYVLTLQDTPGTGCLIITEFIV